MNEQLLSRATAILDYVGETVKKTGDFVVEQAPDIAIQYVAYARATSTTAIVAAVVLGSIAIWGCYKTMRDDDLLYLMLSMFPTIVSVGLLIGNFNKFFMSWFAPKVYLLTEIVKLIK